MFLLACTLYCTYIIYVQNMFYGSSLNQMNLSFARYSKEYFDLCKITVMLIKQFQAGLIETKDEFR